MIAIAATGVEITGGRRLRVSSQASPRATDGSSPQRRTALRRELFFNIIRDSTHSLTHSFLTRSSQWLEKPRPKARGIVPFAYEYRIFSPSLPLYLLTCICAYMLKRLLRPIRHISHQIHIRELIATRIVQAQPLSNFCPIGPFSAQLLVQFC